MAYKKRIPDDFIGNALEGEADRGCVLVGSAYIDYRLELLLRTYFSNVTDRKYKSRKSEQAKKEAAKVLDESFQYTGALLGTGSHKAKLAFLLGLIDAYLFGLWKKINDLRVDCAHHPGKVPLNNMTVKPLMDALRLSDSKAVEARVKNPSRHHYGPRQKKPSEARIRFVEACIKVDSAIYWKAIQLCKDPNKPEGIVISRYIRKLPVKRRP